jgi:predicted phosphodiesterase
MATKILEKNESRSCSVTSKISSENKKILVIPDVHYQFDKVYRILEKEEDYDTVVFLGDFFDFWNDTPDDARKCCFDFQTLCFYLENEEKNYHVLWGNHDLSYAWGTVNKYAKCSGWTPEKSKEITRWMMPEDWDKFQWFLQIDRDILLTHAGLSGYFVRKDWNNEEIFEFLKYAERNSLDKLLTGGADWTYSITNHHGGILWNRPNCVGFKFFKIPDLRQIFGHTFQRDAIWQDDENYCIDTGLRDYIVVKDGKIEVKSL